MEFFQVFVCYAIVVPFNFFFIFCLYVSYLLFYWPHIFILPFIYWMVFESNLFSISMYKICHIYLYQCRILLVMQKLKCMFWSRTKWYKDWYGSKGLGFDLHKAEAKTKQHFQVKTARDERKYFSAIIIKYIFLKKNSKGWDIHSYSYSTLHKQYDGPVHTWSRLFKWVFF